MRPPEVRQRSSAGRYVGAVVGMGVIRACVGGNFAGGLVFVQVVEVEIEQTCRLFNVLVIQRYEAVLEIERNGCSVGIDGDEARIVYIISL